jgi:hypothetical protein
MRWSPAEPDAASADGAEAGAGLPRPALVDGQGAAVKLLDVKGGERLAGFHVLAHLDKA